MTWPVLKKEIVSPPLPDCTDAGRDIDISGRAPRELDAQFSAQRELPFPTRTLHRKRSSYDLRYVFHHGEEHRDLPAAAVRDSHDHDIVTHHIQNGKINSTVVNH